MHRRPTRVLLLIIMPFPFRLSANRTEPDDVVVRNVFLSPINQTLLVTENDDLSRPGGGAAQDFEDRSGTRFVARGEHFVEEHRRALAGFDKAIREYHPQEEVHLLDRSVREQVQPNTISLECFEADLESRDVDTCPDISAGCYSLNEFTERIAQNWSERRVRLGAGLLKGDTGEIKHALKLPKVADPLVCFLNDLLRFRDRGQGDFILVALPFDFGQPALL